MNPTLLFLLKTLIERIFSIDEAIRKKEKLPAPKPLPEDWDKLLEEESEVPDGDDA